MNLRSQQTIQDREELIELGEKEAMPMEVVSDIENEGETEEAAKGGKDSIADVQKLLLSFMQQIQETNDSIKKELQENRDKLEKFENMLQETRNEMHASIDGIVIDLENRMDQRIESVNREVEAIYERTRGQIQELTETVRRDKSESNENIESLRKEVVTVQARTTRQSENVCERVSTCEIKVTELREMAER
jgi:DNA anti-recombination protein RmuC